MISKFCYIPQNAQGMSVIKSPYCTLIDSGTKADMFNILCKWHTSNPKHIHSSEAHFKKRGASFAHWTGFEEEDAPTTLHAALKKQCQVPPPSESEIGMAAQWADIAPNKKPYEGLTIQKVTTQEGLQDLISILKALIPEDADAFSSFYNRAAPILLSPKTAQHLFIGYLNARPIASSCAFIDKSSMAVGLWDIITLPQARRKGIATDMALKALNFGKQEGCEIAVLTATDMGYKVYEKIGFKKLKHYTVYNCR